MSDEKLREPIPKEVREEVRSMFDNHCAYCGIKLRRSFHVDHVVPLAKGGPDEIVNYFPSCAVCNTFKNVYLLEDFRRVLEEQTFMRAAFILAERFGQITAHPKKVVFYFETLGHKFDEGLVKAIMDQNSIMGKES